MVHIWSSENDLDVHDTISWSPEPTHDEIYDQVGEGQGGKGNWRDWIWSKLSIPNCFGSAGFCSSPISWAICPVYIQFAEVATMSREGRFITTLWMLPSHSILKNTTSVTKQGQNVGKLYAHHYTWRSTLYLEISNLYSVKPMNTRDPLVLPCKTAWCMGYCVADSNAGPLIVQPLCRGRMSSSQYNATFNKWGWVLW